jgi:hypothetical protein
LTVTSFSRDQAVRHAALDVEAAQAETRTAAKAGYQACRWVVVMARAPAGNVVLSCTGDPELAGDARDHERESAAASWTAAVPAPFEVAGTIRLDPGPLTRGRPASISRTAPGAGRRGALEATVCVLPFGVTMRTDSAIRLGLAARDATLRDRSWPGVVSAGSAGVRLRPRSAVRRSSDEARRGRSEPARLVSARA